MLNLLETANAEFIVLEANAWPLRAARLLVCLANEGAILGTQEPLLPEHAASVSLEPFKLDQVRSDASTRFYMWPYWLSCR